MRPVLTTCSLLSVAVSSLIAAPVHAGVTVTLANGQTLDADRIVDNPHTDSLDLHRTAEGIRIVRHVRRGDVAAIRDDGELGNDGSVESIRPSVPSTEYLVLGTQYTEDAAEELAPIPAPSLSPPTEEFQPAPAPMPLLHLPMRLPRAWEATPFVAEFACAPPSVWLDARVIGVREDPLAAYAGALAESYPHGVPVLEAGFALHLMRARKAQDVLGGGSFLPVPLPADVPPPLPAPGLPLQRLEAAAFAVNAGGKADWDALAIDLRGLDLLDRPAPFRGTVRVTLRGQPQELSQVHPHQFIAVPGRIETVGTWHRTIDLPTPAVRLVLPLSRPLPDHDPNLFPFADVSVQLLVPGAGVFEATVPQVLLSQISPLRERNRIETGSRFFADEATVDSLRRQRTGGRPDPR